MLSTVNFKSYAPTNQKIQQEPSFKGLKDIVFIDDKEDNILENIWKLKKIAGEDYTIHTALGGKSGIEAVRKFDPVLIITSYNMPKYPGPHKDTLINALTSYHKKLIVKTNNWMGERSRINGVQKCEVECGADKYVHDVDTKMYEKSVEALLKDKEPPRYSFQKTFAERIIDIFKFW